MWDVGIYCSVDRKTNDIFNFRPTLSLQGIDQCLCLPVLCYSGNVLNRWPLHPRKGRASAGLLLMGTPAPP